MIDYFFPEYHVLHKIMNKNTIKISYSCMPNIKQIISSHNKKIIRNHNSKQKTTEGKCNCKEKTKCPVSERCLERGVIYQAKVTNQNDLVEETYVGLTENTFKKRYTEHMSTFNIKEKRQSTALSQHIWSLKEKDIQYSISWKIISHANPYSTSSKLCNLCTEEKYFIIYKPEMASLNKRNELMNSCRHRKKYLLCNT